MTARIEIGGLRRLQKDLGAFGRQVPFAVARALTETAKAAAAAERLAMQSILHKPTPFTLSAPVVKPATKTNLTATLDMRPIQASYLAPEEFATPQRLAPGASNELVPIDIALNSYDNLPRTALKRYAGRKDCFVGAITFRRTGRTIYGVWQRPASGQRRAGGRGTKGRRQQSGAAGGLSGLKLLIEFKPPVVPNVRLGWRERAAAVIQRTIKPQLKIQLAAAIRTAR